MLAIVGSAQPADLLPTYNSIPQPPSATMLAPPSRPNSMNQGNNTPASPTLYGVVDAFATTDLGNALRRLKSAASASEVSCRVCR